MQTNKCFVVCTLFVLNVSWLHCLRIVAMAFFKRAHTLTFIHHFSRTFYIRQQVSSDYINDLYFVRCVWVSLSCHGMMVANNFSFFFPFAFASFVLQREGKHFLAYFGPVGLHNLGKLMRLNQSKSRSQRAKY